MWANGALRTKLESTPSTGLDRFIYLVGDPGSRIGQSFDLSAECWGVPWSVPNPFCPLLVPTPNADRPCHGNNSTTALISSGSEFLSKYGCVRNLVANGAICVED